MTHFLNFLAANRSGILLLLLCVASIVLLVQWLAWIFSLGRFRSDAYSFRRDTGMRYILSGAVVKIINEFGHLIALIILSIFSFTLIFVLVQTRGNAEAMTDAVKTVVSTMGGLVGAVIGYYFNRPQGSDSPHFVEPPREPSPHTLEAPPPAKPHDPDE